VIPRLPQWGKKKEPKKKKTTTFLGVQNEAVRDSKDSSEFVTIVVIGGVGGAAPGSFRLSYYPGFTLKHYFKRLKLLKVAIYHSVYDLTNKSQGKCRLNYVPKAGARIQIGPAGLGMATHLQRSRVDAQRVAANMGGEKGMPGPKVVERRMK
jgi:hypothetical protein